MVSGTHAFPLDYGEVKIKSRNLVNRIRVVFQKSGKLVAGKVDDIPYDLLIDLAGKKDSPDFIGQLVREAENMFLEVYSGTKIEKRLNSVPDTKFRVYPILFCE
jgi:hypothetical protein